MRYAGWHLVREAKSLGSDRLKKFQDKDDILHYVVKFPTQDSDGYFNVFLGQRASLRPHTFFALKSYEMASRGVRW